MQFLCVAIYFTPIAKVELGLLGVSAFVLLAYLAVQSSKMRSNTVVFCGGTLLLILAIEIVRPGPTLFRPDLPEPVPPTGRAEVMVWVDLASGLYHCPGSSYYGRGEKGKHLRQIEAQREHFQPAGDKVCQ